jgi:hypothetical protein
MVDGILIDERGRRWSDRSWELMRRLGPVEPSLTLPVFAVRERGFIHIRPQETGARVALRAGGFGLASLAGALYELKERRFPRIILAMLVADEWFYEMVGGAWEFAERAEHLLAGGPVTVRHPWLAAERDLAALGLQDFAAARPLVQLWHRMRGRLPDDIGAVAADSGLLHRMILVRRRARTSRLVFAHFGAGIECRPPGESDRLIDHDIHDHHDRKYGAWVADAYAEALKESRLHLRSIRATIRVSDTILARGRYDRLILPWRSAGGEDFAMGISLTRDHRSLDARAQIDQQRFGAHP